MSFRPNQITRYAILAALAVTLALHASLSRAAEFPEIRVGALSAGTIQWELDTIKAHELDTKHGVELVIVEMGGGDASEIALQGGAVDAVVSDYIWVSRQRDAGADYAFVPHSLAVGGLVARPDAGINTIADLRGKTIGVAGGPLDKNWLILQAFYKHRTGRTLMADATAQFAAPPLLNELIQKGDLDAVLNFWHYNARLKANGMMEIAAAPEMLRTLGIEAEAPLLGWTFSEGFARNDPDAIRAFLEASTEAKRLLRESDAEWDRLRTLMRAEDDATFTALRDAYRQGIPTGYGEDDIVTATAVFELLSRLGGEALVGDSRTLAPGTFWMGFSF